MNESDEYICEFCRQKLYSKYNLTRHIGRAHSGKTISEAQTSVSIDKEGNWVCYQNNEKDHCGKKFEPTDQISCIQHIKGHKTNGI